jgi:transposase
MQINKTLSLRIVGTNTVDWEEFVALVNQINRMIIPLYNIASLDLYKHLQDPETRLKRGNEKAIVQQWMTKRVYHPVQEVIHNSYIALGVKIKMEANFTGKKVWEIKNGQATPPWMRTSTPLEFNMQNGFTVTDENGEFLIDLPMPSYTKIPEAELDKYKPWNKFTLLESNRKKKITLLLSTKTRKKRGDWISDLGTEAEIKRVLDGTYTVTTLEVLQKDEKWFIHMSIKYDVEPKHLDKDKIGGIHMGMTRPITAAIKDNKYQTFSVYPNTVRALNDMQQRRIREERIGNKYRKGGHGKKIKFAGTETQADEYRERRKKVMEEWSKLATDFFVNNGIGTVYLEGQSNKNAFLAKYKYPVKELLERITRGLEQKGVKVKENKTYFVTQICSECGHYNKGFTYQHRMKAGFPKFKCADCGVTLFTDVNAARNVANPDFESLLKNLALLK